MNDGHEKGEGESECVCVPGEGRSGYWFPLGDHCIRWQFLTPGMYEFHVCRDYLDVDVYVPYIIYSSILDEVAVFIKPVQRKESRMTPRFLTCVIVKRVMLFTGMRR